MENLINGNEMNLDEVLDIAKNLAEESRKERYGIDKDWDFSSGSKMDNFGKIVRGVARKYSVENFGVERDDLEQDLWVKVMEIVNSKNGDVELVDEALVAKCCWNVAVDKYRYHRKRRDSKAEYTEGTEEDDKASNNSSSASFSSSHCFQSATDAIFIKEAIDLFEVGSKERKYVVTKLYMNGEIDPETFEGEDELELPEGDTEKDILKILGYSSHYPASWNSIKNKMRKKIYTYLGKFPEDEAKGSKKRETLIKERAIEIFKESSSYYIYTKKLVKDKVLKMLDCSEEDLVKIFKKDTEKLVVGVGHSSKKSYLMKSAPKYIEIATEEGDELFLEEKE